MLAPADDTTVTRWRRGETGGRSRLITPTSDVTADEFNSLPGSDLLNPAIFPPFICYFDSVLQLSDTR